MANLRWKIKRDGLNEALSQPKMVRELQRISDDVERTAKATAPIQSGAYRDSIEATVDRGWVRPRGRVTAHSEYAIVVEARTGNLARALSSEA